MKVQRFSSAWFDLVRAIPEIEASLRAHENVVIAGEELSLQVASDGVEAFDAARLKGVVNGFRGVAGR